MKEGSLKIKLLLEGLYTTALDIRLEGGFLIRQPLKRELARLSKCTENLGTYYQPHNESIRILEAEFPAEADWWQSLTQVATVLTTLRLVKSGNICYRLSSYEFTPDYDSQRIAYLSETFSLFGQAMAEGKYSLSKGDLEAFKRLWREVREVLAKGAKLGALHMAISRFDSSYSGTQHADKFIDLMIAMEALYLGKDETQELSYRLAQRAALLLGFNQGIEGRIHIRDRVRQLYNKRSKIVHGELNAASSEEVAQLKDYVRSSLKKFLRFYWRTKDGTDQFKPSLLRKLDDLALSRGLHENDRGQSGK